MPAERPLQRKLVGRLGSEADDSQKGERRSWRRFVRRALSDKAQVLLHHWSDGCRCCGGLHAHVTGKSCFGCPSLPAPLTDRSRLGCWAYSRRVLEGCRVAPLCGLDHCHGVHGFYPNLALPAMQAHQLLKSRNDFFRRLDGICHSVRVRDRYFKGSLLASTRYDHVCSPPCFLRRNNQRVRDFEVDGSLPCYEASQRVLRAWHCGFVVVTYVRLRPKQEIAEVWESKTKTSSKC